MRSHMEPTLPAPRHFPARSARCAALLGIGLLALGPSARAQQNAFPTTFEIASHELQKVPTVFKFQSRISQAKIPVGDAVFSKIVVNLNRGTETLCIEEFEDVRVRDSVLNLEIGRNISCDLESIIGRNVGLSLQVCIGGGQNCLKPVELGTVPYAVKSSFAALAQASHRANEAAQAHYAHRVTADRDLFVTHEIGKGYFDFHSPVQTAAVRLLSASEFPTYQNGGFLQWTPTSADPPRLSISAKQKDGDLLVPLDDLVLHSAKTTLRGTASVAGVLTAVGGLSVPSDGRAETAELACEGDSSFGRPDALNGTRMTVQSEAVFKGRVRFDGDVSIGGQLTGKATDLECTTCVGPGDLANWAVTADKLADGSVKSAAVFPKAIVGSHIADGAITKAHFAPGVEAPAGTVPIGAVIDWWRPSASVQPPYGYVIADGRTISDPASPLNGYATPNLTGKFVRGEASVPTSGFTTGGASNHGHTVGVPAHAHSYSVAAHSHGTTVSSNGDHRHQWSRFNGEDWYSIENGAETRVIDWGDGFDSEGEGIWALAINNRSSHSFQTWSAGSHNHTVTAGAAAGSTATTGNGGQAQVNTQSSDSAPPYVGLLKLIRIK